MVREECCASTVERVVHSALKVGALWHIYPPTHTDTIREFIKKVGGARQLGLMLWSELRN